MTNKSEFMQLALRRFQYARSADDVDRKTALEDLRFVYPGKDGLGQWDQDSIDARRAAKRPLVTLNRLGMFAQQIANQGRAARTSIEISPADGGTLEDAEFMQSRIRQVEYESRAQIAYDTARDCQINSGRGFARVCTEYVPGSFKQRARIERIEKQFSVFFDPDAQEYDYSDARYCFVITRMPYDEHRRAFGSKSQACRLNYFSDDQNQVPSDALEWFSKADGMVQVADYYIRECHKRTLCIDFDGTTFYDDEIPAELKAEAMSNVREKREEETYSVTHYVIDGCEVLDEHEWIGSTIPVVPFWGKELVDADGRKCHLSLVNPAKAPQRMLNHAASGMVEMLSIAPKNVWAGAEGQFDTETNWASLHQMATAYVEYKLQDAQGNPAPPPTLVTHEPAIQAQLAAMAAATDGIKAALGIFDASIGAEANEKSGIAIQRRQQQSDSANYHFQDNAIRSIERVGRILVEILPKIDAGKEAVEIRTPEGKVKSVPIGQPYRNDNGKEVIHDLTQITPNSYSVIVSTGPSFKSDMEEANEAEAGLIERIPELMFVFGDQFFRHRGKPGDIEKAKRMEKVINQRNPGLIEDPDQPQQEIPQEVQQQLMAAEQQVQQLTAAVEGLSAEKESKQLELESKERIEMAKLEFEREKWRQELALEYAKLSAKEDETALRTQVERINRDEDREERLSISNDPEEPVEV